MKKALLLAIVILLLAAALLQWWVDSTPAGTGEDEAGAFPAASSLLDLLGGARQYLAFTFFIKSDKLHHTYYGAMTDEDELVPYFKLVTLMDPNYVSAYYVGAGIMDALGKREEAIDFTLQGIEANPESADLYYSLGDLYLREKRYEEAKAAFAEALEYDSEVVSRIMMISALAASCTALGDYEGQINALMDRVLYNQVSLFDEETTYEEGKRIITSINATLNTVMEVVQKAREDGGN